MSATKEKLRVGTTKAKIAGATAVCPLDAKMDVLYINTKCSKCKETVTIKLTPGPPNNTVVERVEAA